LVELSEKAPGTFHHSVTIATLAEAAAEVVGANAILARVGGYYHDIGKILKPEYFIENQMGPHSRHTRLKPRMSALIISAHVREGIELARERGLPEKVIDFIPQHHGTTRISFFYDKALKQAARKPSKDVIVEDDFLYPGPKPQTKETGILMLADSVEAVTRSLTEVTPQKLETAISNMIKHRFMDGQLDECDLTLRDLRKIEEAFHKILMGMYHQRIKYPEPEAEIPTVAESEISPAAVQRPEAVIPTPESATIAPETAAPALSDQSIVQPKISGQEEDLPSQHESSGAGK
jgi:cyclic-di-AMP phosphodiesterase PgpH